MDGEREKNKIANNNECMQNKCIVCAHKMNIYNKERKSRYFMQIY